MAVDDGDVKVAELRSTMAKMLDETLNFHAMPSETNAIKTLLHVW